MKKKAFRALAALVLLAAAIYGGVVFIHSLTHESTDDAFVAGTVIPVAPEVRGRVVGVFVDDNQTVSAGQALFGICPDDYQNALQEKDDAVARLKAEDRELRANVDQRRKSLEQARASFDAALAEESLAAKDLKRYRELQARDVVSQSQFDRVESQWKVGNARRQAAPPRWTRRERR
jgi:membrane fusion protein, multidrug efflux system